MINKQKLCLLIGLSGMCAMVYPIGLTNGNLLSPCNNRWNCAITQRVNGQQPTVGPIWYTGTREEAMKHLKEVLKTFKRVTIISESGCYLHVTFTSWLWKFIDDVEFYLPEDEPVIHMRSASRVGKSDMGVNKSRLKKIKKRFQKKE